MAIYSWVFPLKMVIFHSYVSLPEGIPKFNQQPTSETKNDPNTICICCIPWNIIRMITPFFFVKSQQIWLVDSPVPCQGAAAAWSPSALQRISPARKLNCWRTTAMENSAPCFPDTRFPRFPKWVWDWAYDKTMGVLSNSDSIQIGFSFDIHMSCFFSLFLFFNALNNRKHWGFAT